MGFFSRVWLAMKVADGSAEPADLAELMRWSGEAFNSRARRALDDPNGTDEANRLQIAAFEAHAAADAIYRGIGLRGNTWGDY